VRHIRTSDQLLRDALAALAVIAFATLLGGIVAHLSVPRCSWRCCSWRSPCIAGTESAVVALLEAAIACASRLGAGAIKLMVDLENIGAQRLYDNFGFRTGQLINLRLELKRDETEFTQRRPSWLRRIDATLMNTTTSTSAAS
jgi:hypothetical protein